MRGLLFVAALGLLALCSAQVLTWEAEEVPGSAAPVPNSSTDAAFWGLPLSLNFTPSYEMLFTEHISTTDGNNTDYVVSLRHIPGAYTFTPSELTFRLTLNEGASADFDDDTKITWTPPFALVTAYALNMAASIDGNPLWNFNITAGSVTCPAMHYSELELSFDCLDDAGDSCSGVVNTAHNVTFHPVQMRK